MQEDVYSESIEETIKISSTFPGKERFFPVFFRCQKINKFYGISNYYYNYFMKSLLKYIAVHLEP